MQGVSWTWHRHCQVKRRSQSSHRRQQLLPSHFLVPNGQWTMEFVDGCCRQKQPTNLLRRNLDMQVVWGICSRPQRNLLTAHCWVPRLKMIRHKNKPFLLHHYMPAVVLRFLHTCVQDLEGHHWPKKKLVVNTNRVDVPLVGVCMALLGLN